MGQFNRDRNQGGGRSFGGGGRFNDRGDRPRPEMHPAVCSNCGKSCEVPFRPTGSKPVLCNDCFRGQGGPDRSFGNAQDRRDDRPRFESRRDDRPQTPSMPNYKEQFESLNHKLDKILGILMAATEAEVPAKAKEEILEVVAEEVPVVEKKAKKIKTPKEKVSTPETTE